MKHMIVRKPVSTWDLMRDFDSMLDSVFSGNSAPSARSPRVDVREDEHKYVIVAELPGYSEKDLSVNVEDGRLTISASRDKEEKAEGNYLIRERSAAEYSRSFRLPRNAEGTDISASLKDGLLTVDVPKKEEAKPRTIKVQAA